MAVDPLLCHGQVILFPIIIMVSISKHNGSSNFSWISFKIEKQACFEQLLG